MATLTAAEYTELRDHVESLERDGGALYVDAALLETLPSAALPDGVRAVLRERLGSRDGLELSISTADQQAIDAVPEVPRITLDPAGREVEVAGVQLRCLVCTGTLFKEQPAQIHTALASFLNVEWTGPTATCCICTRCGYIHWFAT